MRFPNTLRPLLTIPLQSAAVDCTYMHAKQRLKDANCVFLWIINKLCFLLRAPPPSFISGSATDHVLSHNLQSLRVMLKWWAWKKERRPTNYHTTNFFNQLVRSSSLALPNLYLPSTTILIFVGYYRLLVPGFNRIARKCMWLRRSMMTRVGVNRPKMFAFSLISSFIKNTELLWKKTTIMFSLFY